MVANSLLVWNSISINWDDLDAPVAGAPMAVSRVVVENVENAQNLLFAFVVLKVCAGLRYFWAQIGPKRYGFIKNDTTVSS